MRFSLFYNVYRYKNLSSVTPAKGVRRLLFFRRKPGVLAGFCRPVKRSRNKKNANRHLYRLRKDYIYVYSVTRSTL
jgi:hypothetical protein